MKINYEFYNKEQEDLTLAEKEVIEIIKTNNKNEYNKILQSDTRPESILALSELRQNILNWYPFKVNATILEIEANYGELTELLCKKATKVVSVTNSNEKAQAIQKRLEEYDNLELIVGNFEDINLGEKFDYITLNGTLELYNKKQRAKDKLRVLLNKLSNYLKEDGKVLIAVDNKFGMKHFTSLYEDDTILANGNKALSKKDIISVLEENNYKFKKFYYPLPDYKMTNVIFTDKYLPNQENIARNFTYPDKEFISYNQTESYKEILRDDKNKFEFFANSYFVEVSKENFEDNKIKFVSFTNIRKEKHRIKTIMYEDRVEKQALNSKSEEHICQMKENIECLVKCGLDTLDKFEANYIISKYVGHAMTYDQVLTEKLKKKDFDGFYLLLETYKEKLLNKLEIGSSENNIFDKYEINYDKESIKKLRFAKYGLWDIIFQNVFYIDDKMYLFDQEWHDENVPLEFIMYRAVLYFKELPRYIPREEVYKKMGIDEYVELFKKLDDKIQLQMRDDYMWNLHISTKNGQMLLNLFSDASIKLMNEKQINNDKTQKITELEKEINEKQKQYDEISKRYQELLSSTSWKVTKPLRAIGKHIKLK